MKRNSPLIGLTLMVCSFGLAQDTNGERVVVPARDTTHARKVDVSLMGGSITVKSYSGKEVIVEAGGGGRHSRRDADRAPDGMRRVGLPICGREPDGRLDHGEELLGQRSDRGGRRRRTSFPSRRRQGAGRHAAARSSRARSVGGGS